MTAELQLNDPETLDRRWEGSQWSPYEIDLSADRAQWPSLADRQRGLVHFVLASLPGDGDAGALLGVTEEDLAQFALGGLTRRLEIIGVPLSSS